MKTLCFFLMLSTLSAFVKDTENCKLTIRRIKGDKAKIKVELVHADDKKDCKAKAKERELTDDAEEKITVSYGYIGQE